MLVYTYIILAFFQASPQSSTHQVDPTEAVTVLIKQADTFSNPSEVLERLNNALDYQASISDSLLSVLYYKLGVALGRSYASDSATTYFNKVLDICGKTGDKNMTVAAYNGLGNIARNMSKNEEAADLFKMALDIAESEETVRLMGWRARLLGNMAGIFFDVEDYQTALEYSSKGLGYAKRIGEKGSTAMGHVQMGYVFNAMGRSDSALSHNKKAAVLLEQLQDSAGLIYQYYNIAGIYKKLKDYDQARRYFQKCLEIAEPFGEVETYIGSLYHLGSIAFGENKLEKSQEFAFAALKEAKGNTVLAVLVDTYSLLYEIHKKKGLYRKALEYRDLEVYLRDSLKSEETLQKINDFKVKYETAEKEKMIVQLNAQNQVKQLELDRRSLYQKLLITALILILIGAWYVYSVQRNKSKLREEVMAAELSELRIKIRQMLGKYEGKMDVDVKALNDKLMTPLSEREFDVLNHIFSQKSNQEIADALFVSINTVKTHLKNIYSKLGVSNRKEALEAVSRSD